MATKQGASTVLLTKDINAHQGLSKFLIVLRFPLHVEIVSEELQSLAIMEIQQGASIAPSMMDITVRRHIIKVLLVISLNVEME